MSPSTDHAMSATIPPVDIVTLCVYLGAADAMKNCRRRTQTRVATSVTKRKITRPTLANRTDGRSTLECFYSVH